MPIFEPADPDDKTAESLQCPICIDPFTLPVELSCEHMLCLACIVNEAGTALLVDTCPTCRSAILHLAKPNRLIINLAADLVMRCSDCQQTMPNSATASHACGAGGGAASSVSGGGGDPYDKINRFARRSADNAAGAGVRVAAQAPVATQQQQPAATRLTAPPARPVLPPSQRPPAATAEERLRYAREDELRIRLTCFYSAFAPAKLANIEAIIQRYAHGREEELFRELVARYGPEPADNQPAGAAPRRQGSNNINSFDPGAPTPAQQRQWEEERQREEQMQSSPYRHLPGAGTSAYAPATMLPLSGGAGGFVAPAPQQQRRQPAPLQVAEGWYPTADSAQASFQQQRSGGGGYPGGIGLGGSAANAGVGYGQPQQQQQYAVLPNGSFPGLPPNANF